MSLVDVALRQDPSGVSVCVTIFVLRAIQGIAVGLLYVLVQVWVVHRLKSIELKWETSME